MLSHSMLAIASVAGFIVITDKVPNFNFQPSCQAATREMPARVEQCVKSEEEARATLTAEWTQFPVGDRATCIGASSAGGSPSYVELLVCLKMKGEVQEIRRKNPNPN